MEVVQAGELAGGEVQVGDVAEVAQVVQLVDCQQLRRQRHFSALA